MDFIRETAIQEMIWEYDFSEKQATKIVDKYISDNKFKDLCDLLVYRKDALREVL